MGNIQEVAPVKLVCGLIYGDDETYQIVLERLEKMYGPVEFESEHSSFSHTDYYTKEMGAELTRTFISFVEPVQPDKLNAIKLATNTIEQEYTNEAGGRRINIDPGYVTMANLVLASTKDFSHRIYIGNGIYAEITLLYEDKAFRPLKWTYPDYQTDSTLSFLKRVRESLKDFISVSHEKAV
ncbi:MAG: DUF4416 family protein [Candidatus Zixiibacteriota bacterium]